MHRKRRLRTPFVATFAAAAAAGACGGRVSDGTPNVVANPPVVTSDAGDGCPSEMPSGNEACTLPRGVTCNYGDCYGSPTGFASCVDGRWTLGGTSCNPPPPSYDCPPLEPTAGAACNAPSASTCTYHANECDAAHNYQAARSYVCVGNKWQNAPGSICNPPAPQCPADVPKAGTACYGSLKCDYGNCYGTPTTEAICNGGVWQMMITTCNPPAPDAGG